jgi:hypothetical protein
VASLPFRTRAQIDGYKTRHGSRYTFPRRKRRPSIQIPSQRTRSNWSEERVLRSLKALEPELRELGLALDIQYEPDELETDLPIKGGGTRRFKPDFRVILIDLDDPEQQSLATCYFEVTRGTSSVNRGHKIAKIKSVDRVDGTTVVLIGPGRLEQLKEGRSILEYFPYNLRQYIEERQTMGLLESGWGLSEPAY